MGRELIFADPRIIDLVTDFFVPVAADDWYQRRRQDDEGEFFRKVAEQGPRKGNSTRQGIYVLTAWGQLLGYRNHQDTEVMRRFLRDALDAWQDIPPQLRRKGTITIPAEKKLDPRFARTPPKGGLILNVYTRILERGDDCYVHGSCRFPGGQRAAHDHLWLTAEELAALLPKEAKKGQEIIVPAPLLYRLARYHLVDNTRGEPSMWLRSQVRSAQLKVVVEMAGADEIRLKLTGAYLLTAEGVGKAAQRGYDVQLLGEIRYEPAAGKITRFNMVALGDHWGEGPYTGGARPGRTPLGVAFELADPERAADLVAPQFLREGNNYYRAEQ